MQLAPVPIEVWRLHGIFWCFLIYDYLTSVILVNVEAVLA